MYYFQIPSTWVVDTLVLLLLHTIACVLTLLRWIAGCVVEEAKVQKRMQIESTFLVEYTLWQYGLWSFQTGVTKLERFLPKNQHTRRKLLNFENWVMGRCQKYQNLTKIWLSKSIFYVKNYPNLFQFFFHWRISI